MSVTADRALTYMTCVTRDIFFYRMICMIRMIRAHFLRLIGTAQTVRDHIMSTYVQDLDLDDLP